MLSPEEIKDLQTQIEEKSNLCKEKAAEERVWLKEKGLKVIGKVDANYGHEQYGAEAKEKREELIALRAERDELKAKLKEGSPKKQSAARSKYTYPEDVKTPGEKKRYRSQQRALKKKEEKAKESPEATEEVEAAKPAKKVKKKVAPKKPVATAEDMD